MVNDYSSVTPQGRRWANNLAMLDELHASSFRRHCGGLADAFFDCMTLIAAAFEMPGRHPQGQQEHVQEALAVLNHSYEMLIAMWQQIEAGRASAAATFRRSLIEAPDCIFALLRDESFLEIWRDPTILESKKAVKAAARVRKYWNAWSTGAGEERYSLRFNARDQSHVYAHVGPTVAQLTLTASREDGNPFAGSGAADYEVLNLAFQAIALADEHVRALSLSGLAMPDGWRAEAEQTIRAVYDYRQRILEDEA